MAYTVERATSQVSEKWQNWGCLALRFSELIDTNLTWVIMSAMSNVTHHLVILRMLPSKWGRCYYHVSLNFVVIFSPSVTKITESICTF